MNNNTFTQKIITVCLAFAFLAPALTTLNIKAQAEEGSCLEWSLFWKTEEEGTTSTSTSRIGTLVTGSFINPVEWGNDGSSKSSPPNMPADISSDEAEWKCSINAKASATSKAGESDIQGMELCLKAAEISAKWGGFTALDYVQKDLINSMKGYLGEEIGGALGIDFKLDSQKYLDEFKDAAGNFLKENFDGLVTNPAKEAIAKQVDDIKKAVQKELAEIGAQFIKDTVGDITGGIIASKVPVEDKELTKETTLVKENTAKIIAEQKRAILVQDTRDKCSLIYKGTIDTIKRSILYQFSTQITDWIVKDEKPQFIKSPGKFLEDTARLAVDRTISKIAPNLCEPFRLNVQIQIPTVAREANPFYEQVTCTLDQVTSNIENFYNNFRDGGWVAYQEMWKPQNNYFGAMMLIESELAAQQQAALQMAQDDLNRGQGFRSERQCTEWTLHKKIECPAPGPDGSVTASMRRAMGITEMIEDDCYKTSVFAEEFPEDGSAPDLPADASPDDYYSCTKNEITTPATLTSDISKRAQQTDFDYISQMQSNDIENFLETIENAIINKLVKSGVKGLRNLLKGLPKLP